MGNYDSLKKGRLLSQSVAERNIGDLETKFKTLKVPDLQNA